MRATRSSTSRNGVMQKLLSHDLLRGTVISGRVAKRGSSAAAFGYIVGSFEARLSSPLHAPCHLGQFAKPLGFPPFLTPPIQTADRLPLQNAMEIKRRHRAAPFIYPR